MLRYPLFEIGDTQVSLLTLIVFAVIVTLTFWTSTLMRQGIRRAFQLRQITDERTLGMVLRLTHYFVLAVGLGGALTTIGIDLRALFAAGAVFAVGLGFAMKNLTENFMSGIILLLEASIRPGDVLLVEGELVKVKEMGIRSTVVRTRDGDALILPNSMLVSDAVRNYSMGRALHRVRADVGVAYGSDMDQVYRVLEDAALDFPGASELRPPLVLMTGFGDNAVNFEVYIWIEDAWTRRIVLSQLNQALWRSLQRAGITIAFPQLDVHLDAEVTSTLSRLTAVP